jgi:hypothetical protein
MKKIQLFGVVSILLILGFSPVSAQTSSSPLGVSLTLTNPAKKIYYPLDPLQMNMVLSNSPVFPAGSQIVVPEGFSNKSFVVYLIFKAPDGSIITVRDTREANTPPPPRVVLDSQSQLVAAEPVEILTTPWQLGPLTFNVLDYYSLLKGGEYFVKVQIPLTVYDPTKVQNNNFVPLGNSIWQGIIESAPVAFTLVRDFDGDGYFYPLPYGQQARADCDDNNPAVNPGAQEIAGNGIDDDCNPATLDKAPVPTGTIQVLSEKHTVGAGKNPDTIKEPIVGLPVRVYSKSAGSCASRFGVSWQNYKSIWLSCNQPEGAGLTGGSGIADIKVVTGDYLVIGRFDPDTNLAGDEIYMGVSAGNVAQGEVKKKYLQLIVKVDGKKVPAKYSVLTGSELLVIEPEYVEWDGTRELYPFIFESVGVWSVTTSVVPPEGFVSDYKVLSAEVNTDLKAIQFTITDVGSKWVSSRVEHKIKHKGRTETIRSQVGIKLSERLARHKNLGRFGEETPNKNK